MARQIFTIAITLALCVIQAPPATAQELKGLRFLANIFSGRLFESTLSVYDTDSAATTAANATHNSNAFICSNCTSARDFVAFVGHAERLRCLPGDRGLALDDGSSAADRPEPIVLPTCRAGFGNGQLKLVDSYTDLWRTIVKPHLNYSGRLPPVHGSTEAKRVTVSRQPGGCSLVLFYTRGCYMSSQLAWHFNAMPHLFPDVNVAAIDAMRFSELNVELGLIGLPSVVMFRQGLPPARMNLTVWPNYRQLAGFVSEMVALKSRMQTDEKFALRSEHLDGPLTAELLKPDADWCLCVAWAFIALCSIYRAVQSRSYAALVAWTQRLWRESAEAAQPAQR